MAIKYTYFYATLHVLCINSANLCKLYNYLYAQVTMTVQNTTGVCTLFVFLAVILMSTAFVTYCKTVGLGNPTGRLTRRDGWYGVDISMVLNALIRRKDVSALMRLQCCEPPMPTKKEVFAFLDAWYDRHKLKECFLIFVFDGRRCPHKRRNEKTRRKRNLVKSKRDSARTMKTLEKTLRKLVTIDADVLY